MVTLKQYYGVLEDKQTAAFVAFTPERVKQYAIDNPESGVKYVGVYGINKMHIIDEAKEVKHV